MKAIAIFVEYPHSLRAVDSEEQEIIIRRLSRSFLVGKEPSDSDACTVTSFLVGDSKYQTGSCKWGQAFAVIQDIFNCSALDNGPNTKESK